jgi:hypothetical protein
MPLGEGGQKQKPPHLYSKFYKYGQKEKKPPNFVTIPEEFFSKAILHKKSNSMAQGEITQSDLSRPRTTMAEANHQVAFMRSPIMH